MGRQSHNQRHTPQRRNPKLPLPPLLVAHSALKPPPLPPQALWPPTSKGMNTFVNHFSTCHGGNTRSQNSATAPPAYAPTTKPLANTGAKKPRASGLRKH